MVDECGYIYLAGWESAFINSGKNAFPYEVGEIINRHPVVELSGLK